MEIQKRNATGTEATATTGGRPAAVDATKRAWLVTAQRGLAGN